MGMGKRVVWLMMINVAQVVVIVLLFSLINVGEASHSPHQVIHVGGQVLCQDCTQGWNEWVHGATPLKGCKVSVTCMDDRKRIVYYGRDETDKTGEFEVVISKYVNGKEIKPENCFTRLVSSPDPVCNIPTDFSGGKTGVKLHRPSIVYRDIIKHVLGPFYYTTPMCAEPDNFDNPPYGK